jgi:hypothetical protein
MNDNMTVLAITIFVADDRSVLDNGQSPSRALRRTLSFAPTGLAVGLGLESAL